MEHICMYATRIGLVVLSIVMVACSASDSVVLAPEQNTTTVELFDHLVAKAGAKSAQQLLTPKNSKGQIASAVTPVAVCTGVYSGTSTRNAIFDVDSWNYYVFYGSAGDVVGITVTRTGCGMDPAFALYQGQISTTDNVALGSDNSELTYILFHDDDIDAALSCGCNADASNNSITLPATGWYTIAVFDFLGCEADITYSLTIEGVECPDDTSSSGDGGSGSEEPADTDGDGVADDEDAYPHSDMQSTIVIGSCNSSVANQHIGNGAFMMDLINEAADQAKNRGGFVSKLANLTNEWKKQKLMSGKEKGRVMECAEQ